MSAMVSPGLVGPESSQGPAGMRASGQAGLGSRWHATLRNLEAEPGGVDMSRNGEAK
jgi:hypothetical protein